jgi:predicted transcriptional regulator
MCKEIARQQGVTPQMVMNYFNGATDNYDIEIETEWREDE